MNRMCVLLNDIVLFSIDMIWLNKSLTLPGPGGGVNRVLLLFWFAITWGSRVILRRKRDLTSFFTFSNQKGSFLGFPYFLQFYWYIKYKRCFGCTRYLSNTTKKIWVIKWPLFPQLESKLELFSWFWRPRTLFYVYFGFSFHHISFNTCKSKGGVPGTPHPQKFFP